MSMYEWESEMPGETAFESWEMPGETQHEQYEQFETYEQHEQHEMEMAYEEELSYELLEITNEAELEEFLGKLIRGAVKGVGSFMKSGVGKAIGGVLKGVAKTALPMVGSALGSLVAPGIGTAIGGKLGSMASSLLETGEAEMLGEQAELEMARRYVRWARATTRNAAMAPATAPPYAVARSAAVTAARRHAPALLRPYSPPQQAQWRARRTRRYSGRPTQVRRPAPVRAGGPPQRAAAWGPAPARRAPRYAGPRYGSWDDGGWANGWSSAAGPEADQNGADPYAGAGFEEPRYEFPG